jgi:hypothetical protein
MATFGEMQSYVSKRLLDSNNTAVSLPDVAAAINESIRYWKFRRLWFNTKVDDTLTLTAQSSVITLPSDFLVENPSPSGLVINWSDARYPLHKEQPYGFDAVFLENGLGLPTIYTVKNGVYYCYFVPDQAYPITFYYLKEYADLQGNNETNDWTMCADRLICLWTLSKLHGELRQDPTMESYYNNAAQNELENLSLMTGQVNNTGHLTIHSCL